MTTIIESVTRLNTFNVRALAWAIRSGRVSVSPCPVCSDPLNNQCNKIVFHPANAVNHDYEYIRISGPQTGEIYLAALEYNLSR